MKSWVSTFQRLRWKLTLRSMVVTVSALLVVVLILGGLLLTRILIPIDFLNRQTSPATWIQLVRNDFPETIRYILTQDPVDTNLVQRLMTEGELQITETGILRVGDLEFRIATIGTGTTLLLDSQGVLLGMSNQNLVPLDAVGKRLDPGVLPGLQAPLDAALAGDLNPDRLFVTLVPNEKFYFTVPLVDDALQKVVGVAVVYVEHLPTEENLTSNLWMLLGRSALLLLFSAALVGLVFGFLTAKGIVDRLQHASQVTDAWSQGDFSEYIDDPVRDEIGQLGERLNRMARQLKSLLKRREEIAIVEERNRLARDLHDSAKQQALAASFQIGTALTLYDRDPETAMGHLKEADRLVDSVREELTDLIMELRPQDLETKPIDAILSDYVVDWSHQHEFTVDLHMQEGLALEIGAKQTLLRILQEGLANIARHSSATHVSIRLESRAGGVALNLEDDGVGFDPSNGSLGVGIHSMMERAESIGGSLVLNSAPGQGTSISVRIPVGE